MKIYTIVTRDGYFWGIDSVITDNYDNALAFTSLKGARQYAAFMHIDPSNRIFERTTDNHPKEYPLQEELKFDYVHLTEGQANTLLQGVYKAFGSEYCTTHKIPMIRLYRYFTNAGLKEAKGAVEAFFASEA